MTDLQRLHQATRAFLARLLVVSMPAASDLLRRIADELDWLEQDRLDAEL